ncbi:MAG: hypothetical protein H6767_01835 [Candidatus Peribacteria bacterium]|nr:MAG: hypothetical protein H6767_01835 [Candidatus Peribacteria bacterium]
MDTTFLITKKNFVIIGINSVNEFLLESIISLYYKKYFDLLLKETGFETYIKHELLKVERVIMENHDGTYRGFSSMI